MAPLDIRIELLRKGYTNVKVGNELGLSPKTVHTVIYRHGRSRPVADRLAKITGIPIDTLFPGEYNKRSRLAA